MGSRAHLPSPKKRRLNPRGEGRQPVGMEGKELAERGRAGPTEPGLCLGLGKFEILFLPQATPPKILSREKVTFRVLFIEVLLRASHCAGYFMNIRPDPHKGPTHFIDWNPEAQREVSTCPKSLKSFLTKQGTVQ